MAEVDAEAAVDGALWYSAGCLLPGAGVLAAMMVSSTPPVSRLMGLTSAETAVYSVVFVETSDSIRRNYALAGCLTYVALVGAVQLWLTGLP